MTEFLRTRGAHVTSYIPARMEEGYGLNEIAIRALHKKGVQLIVTVDCGITASSEAALCRSLGIDLVITDHHECKASLPEAVAVIDPHRKDQPLPHIELAGVGVALKLVLALGGENREDALFARYCTLAAIGTIAGCYVKDGKVTRDSQVRVLRDNIVIYDGAVGSLQRFKDSVKEVAANYECGMSIEKFNDIKEGDIIEAFTMEEIPQ